MATQKSEKQVKSKNKDKNIETNKVKTTTKSSKSIKTKSNKSSNDIKISKNKKEVVESKKNFFDKKFHMDILDVMIVIVITAIASCVLTGVILNVQFRKMNPSYNIDLSSNENIKEFLDVYSEVVNNYYEEIDEKGMIAAGIDGMMKFLGDNYSIYMNSKAADSLNESLENSYEGIGVVSSYNVVYKVYEGTPAYEAGIKENDVIIKVNGVDISEENFEQISILIQNNDDVNEIVVKRGEEELTFKVKKATVSVPVVSSRVIEFDKTKIGYISLSSFSTHSHDEFAEALIDLEKNDIESLIIDLRDNTGGYLTSARNIASIFLEKGKVIYSLENKDKTETVKDETNESRKYKIVVLVNGSTASASEVVTAALKDSYGATIVGKKTFGKGKVQNTSSYGNGSMIKYTSAKWLRPNGECIDEVGIEPDYDINLEYSGNLVYDKQLDKAIELLK